MSEKLRFFDPQLKEKPEQELFNEPEWLTHLRQLDGQIRVRKHVRSYVCLFVFTPGIYKMKHFVFSSGISNVLLDCSHS